MFASLNLESAALADQLERSIRGGAWHGPAVMELLTGVDAPLARRVPDGGGHSIFELVGHIGFWLDAASIRIATPGDRGSDDPWPSNDDGTDRAWTVALAALDSSYTRLGAVVKTLDDDDLDEPVSHADATVRGLLLGLLQHNAYHAGQIMQIVKMAEGGTP
jgi:hypothetical protein